MRTDWKHGSDGNDARALARRRAAALALSCSLTCLLAACSGGDTEAVDDEHSRHALLAQELAGDRSARAAVLDADALATVDAAARQAADAHGAPGEAEPVVYLVHARERGDAIRLARELEARGFGPLFVLP